LARNENYWKIVAKNGFTLVILDIFIFVASILINLLPSIYDILEEEYKFNSPAILMISDAMFIIIAASTALYWGYLIDKIDRRRVLYYSLATITIGLLISTFSSNFLLFFIGRVISAIGFGAQMPSSYSILADIIPAKYWSTLYGSIALLISIANAVGNFLSGFLTPLNIWNLGWKFPFALLAIVSVICFLLITMIKLPNRGASDLELVDKDLGEKIRKGKLNYPYYIRREELKQIWSIASNRFMLYLCFFAVIPGATMGTFLIYYLKTGPFSSFPPEIVTQISQIFAAMVGFGYLLGTSSMGSFFDRLNEKSLKNRAKFTSICLMIALPLLILAFVCITPVDYSALNLYGLDLENSLDFTIYIEIISKILTKYPSYIAYFFLLLIGSFLVAPISINRTPTLLDVNLPEHNGTSQAILNFSDQSGKGITYIFLAFQYIIFSWFLENFDGKLILFLSLFFYIAPTLWWYKISKKIESEFKQKQEILMQRAQELKKTK